MEIILSPIADNRDTTVSVSGLVVTVDGTPYDLSVIPVGGDADPAEGEPFIGKMTRESVTVLYRYNSATAEPNQSTDIADYTFNVTDGPVPNPIVQKPEPVIEPEPAPEEPV